MAAGRRLGARWGRRGSDSRRVSLRMIPPPLRRRQQQLRQLALGASREHSLAPWNNEVQPAGAGSSAGKPGRGEQQRESFSSAAGLPVCGGSAGRLAARDGRRCAQRVRRGTQARSETPAGWVGGRARSAYWPNRHPTKQTALNRQRDAARKRVRGGRAQATVDSAHLSRGPEWRGLSPFQILPVVYLFAAQRPSLRARSSGTIDPPKEETSKSLQGNGRRRPPTPKQQNRKSAKR